VDDEIINRKFDHLKIPIEYDVQHPENYFKYIRIIHHSLPTYELNEIDLSIEFFGKKVSAPICIAGMTGGHSIAKNINKILAKAADKENIIMGVGSQRVALENPNLSDTFEIVRQEAPEIPIIGNIGIGQISDKNFNETDFERCIDMIDADVMAIHFNALHELIQNKGNTSFKLFEKNFLSLRKHFKIPIIAKETGTGFNSEIAKYLDGIGFDGFDIGGYGGTSFPLIESKRNNSEIKDFSRNPAEVFNNWGIPTPVSVLYVRSVSSKPIIATGGLRSGIDIVKAILLGADIGGIAYNFLTAAWKDYKQNSIENTIREIKTLKNEIRAALWLINSNSITKIKGDRKKLIYLGNLYYWLNQISF